MEATVNEHDSPRGARLAAMVALASLLAVAGCGGSGGGGESRSPVPVSSGHGTLKVTVRDVFGAPVAGARVQVSEYSGSGHSPPSSAITDSSGNAQIRDVPAGMYGLDVRTAGGYGYVHGSLEKKRTVTADVVLHPASEDAGGVVRAWVPDEGVSSDGRTLEFKLQLGNVPGQTRIYSEYSEWADEEGDPWSSVIIESCQPSSSSVSTAGNTTCVVGADSSDAPYVGMPSAAPVDLQMVQEPTSLRDSWGYPAPAPFQVVLLVDDGMGTSTGDAGNLRLLAAKYFMAYAGPGYFSALLGAYAADDSGSRYGPALLPQKPLTVFPVENPAFTTDGRSYFSAIDGLRVMEGGANPLFAAIDRAIDLQVSAGGDVPRSVVVITDGGRDDTCGSADACSAARDALLKKSRDTGVAIVVVGYEGWNPPDWLTLGLLGQGAPGSATFWAGTPDALAPTLRTVRKYLAQMKRTAIATFRIESPTPGAFASGRTVLGWVSNGWDCGLEPCASSQRIPFAVTIP